MVNESMSFIHSYASFHLYSNKNKVKIEQSCYSLVRSTYVATTCCKNQTLQHTFKTELQARRSGYFYTTMFTCSIIL